MKKIRVLFSIGGDRFTSIEIEEERLHCSFEEFVERYVKPLVAEQLADKKNESS